MNKDIEETRRYLESALSEARLTEELFDASQISKHNIPMTDTISRPELDAKLETIGAKMDGRLARIEDRFTGLERRFDKLETMLDKQKYTAWAAAGATIVAVSGIVFAAYAMGFGAFDSGRETAKLAADAQHQTSAALTEIRQIVESLKVPPR